MVHIPFLNIEFPEPRVLEIIPDTVVTVIRLCSRVLDVARDAVYPLTEDARAAKKQAELASIPREFDRVVQRAMDGKIRNDEQLSSELEDASYEYYRRMLRTSVAGASDEPHEEFMRRQLFGRHQLQGQDVLEQYALQHPEVCPVDTEELLEKIGVPDVSTSTSQLRERWAAIEVLDTVQHAQLTEQQRELRSLRKRALSSMAQTSRGAVNAGVGMGLGVLLFKGIGWGVQRLLRTLKKGQKKTAPSRPPGRTPRGGAPLPQPTPTKAARGSAGRSSQESAQQSTQPAASSASAPKAAAAASKEPAAKTGTAEAPARRARPSTRTR